MTLYYLGNFRTEEQRAEMQRLEAAGICIFCPGQLPESPEQPVVLRTAHWTVRPNRYPYKGTQEHLLLIPNEHVTDLVELSPEAQQDFWQALAQVREKYALTYYGLGARNGDFRFTGGTIEHLHIHIVVGDVDNPDHEPVRIKLSSRPKSE